MKTSSSWPFSSVVVGILLLGATIFTTIRTAKLTKQLHDAHSTIAALEAGSLRSNAAPPKFNGPVTLIPLGVDGQANSPRHCDACDVKMDPTVLSNAVAKAIKSIPELSLVDLKHQYLPSDPDREKTLFIFFSPVDCPACLKEAAVWQRLADAGPSLHLSVVGIVDRCSKQEADSARQNLAIKFPILVDPQSALRTLYGILRTPEKVLVDKNGKVLLTSPADETPESQEAFEQQISRVSK